MKSSGRYIWDLDCIAICAVLGFLMDKKSIDKTCRKFGYSKSGKPFTTSFGYYLLHKNCHKNGGLLPKYITKKLNERFAKTIEIVRNLDDGSEDDISIHLKDMIKDKSAAIMWALLSDPREGFQHLGFYLVHDISHQSFRNAREEVLKSNQETQALQTAESRLKEMRETVSSRHKEATDLRTTLQKTEQKITDLEEVCHRQELHIAELDVRPQQEAVLTRRIRMLEHELEETKKQNSHLKIVTEDRGTVVNMTIAPLKSKPPALACIYRERDEDDKCSGTNECEIKEGEQCPLESLSVAVIGGLDRLEPHYRRVVENMGGEFLFHNGRCKGGGETLKNAVCKSDIVIFFTRINSHSAMHVVKGMCKKTGKRFAALRATSPSALESILQGAA